MNASIHAPIDLIEAAQRLQPFMAREARQGRNTSRLFKRLLRAWVRHGAMTDFDWFWLTVNLAALTSTPATGLLPRVAGAAGDRACDPAPQPAAHSAGGLPPPQRGAATPELEF